MNTFNDNVFEAIAGITRLTTDLVVMEAIWLDKPIQTARKRTIRLTKGDLVRVRKEGDECYLVDCTEELGPTHVILECKGTIYWANLQVLCEDLDTDELLTVKL